MDWTTILPIIRGLLVVIVAGFIPISAISFFSIMVPQKERDFQKSITEMGISTTRKVRDSYSAGKYFLPVLFSFLICLVAIVSFIYGMPSDGEGVGSLFLEGAFFGGEDAQGVANQSLSVLTYAFLGSFVYAAQNIIRRLIANDLPPSVYYSAGIRIILACGVALVLSFLLGSESESIFNLKGSLPALALLAGIFPQRILNFLMKRFREIVAGDSITERSLSLYNIEGISIYHKERLEEIGIDNAQNLATASLTQLIAETPFDARQLLDWIGQAKLVCYAKDEIHKLRAVGIRSIFDLMKGNKSREALREIADLTGINTPILEVIQGQILEDEGINALFKFQQKKNSPAMDAIATMEMNKAESKRIIVPN